MKIRTAFLEANTDKGRIHEYDRFYDIIFNNYAPKSLLEIGIKTGSSLSAWKILFPECNIFGIDITNNNFNPARIKFSDAKIIIGDATKIEIVDKLEKDYDVIIDDGSHYYKDIIKTFKLFHTRFNKYYIIEDWHYDLDIAKKFLNSYGYYNINFYKSKRSEMTIPKRDIFRTKSNNYIKIDQNMIVVSR
jgi:cephalosporin hydroxylase